MVRESGEEEKSINGNVGFGIKWNLNGSKQRREIQKMLKLLCFVTTTTTRFVYSFVYFAVSLPDLLVVYKNSMCSGIRQS